MIDEDVVSGFASQPASEVEPRPLDWLWRDRFPLGMLSVIVGMPDQGKSLFTAYLAAQISQEHAVIFVSLEDAKHETQRPRVQAAGGVLDRIHFTQLTLPRDTPKLEALVIEEDARLVTLDPIAAILTASIYNDQAVRRALDPVKAMAERTRCAVVMVCHPVKRIVGSNPLSAIGGAGAGLVAASRGIYAFGPHPDSKKERVLLAIKHNIAAPQPYGVEFRLEEWCNVDAVYRLLMEDCPKDCPGAMHKTVIETARLVFVRADTKFDPIPLLKTAKEDSPDKLVIAAQWLLGFLREGPRRTQDIETESMLAGIAWRTLRRASDRLRVVKIRHEGGGRGSYTTWELPLDV